MYSLFLVLDSVTVVTQKEGVAEEGAVVHSTDGQVIDRTEKVGQFNVPVYVCIFIHSL